MSQRRSLTQQMASHIYDLEYNGIYYQSRHGTDLENWALFEPFHLKNEEHWNLRHDDPDFQEALTRFELKFNPRL
jgi:RES domain